MHRKFLRDTIICLLPILIAGLITARAVQKYQEGKGGFKLGVDLVGGTILVYEVDLKKTQELKKKTGDSQDVNAPPGVQAENFDMAQLAAALKRRIDPADLKNILIRPVGATRVEVILPTGGGRSADNKVDLTADEVNRTKELIRQVGSLEFLILANETDDAAAIKAVRDYFANPANKGAIETAARNGDAPAVPVPPAGEQWLVHDLPARYRWVELGKVGRKDKGLSNEVATDPAKSGFWQVVAATRPTKDNPNGTGLYTGVDSYDSKRSTYLLYSRDITEQPNLSDERKPKKYEYYMLCRASDSVKVGGAITIEANVGQDSKDNKPAVNFTFNAAGGRAFYDVTNRNRVSGGEGGQTARQLGVVLDDYLISYPRLNSAISDNGQISGGFTQAQVNEMVTLLRSGALPATLKGEPVAENSVSASLGADTIAAGTVAVGIAFVAILVFMCIYYQFAGLVASVALLANLLLTVGFMVAVNATFTLPGLAGLVLMLGMAVDANVLIYERVREERDKGASLAMAIRNGYDRAFGTIIDTHLSSIFTAIVLYSVGNDQLKGFGISLTLGLLISLFTSLFMTRLIFDFWLKKGWLTRLRMFRFFSKPNIDFMSIRKQMFALTAILTIAGLGLFLARAEKGVNVDFIGGTAYGGQLRAGKEQTISELRKIIEGQEVLAVAKVEKLPNERYDNSYKITYKDNEAHTVVLASAPEGIDEAAQIENVKARASILPDWSVEQTFRRDESGDKSRFFTVRTTERERELVQVSVERLFREKDGSSLLAQTDMIFARDPNTKDPTWILTFVDPTDKSKQVPTSISYVKTLIDREFRSRGATGVLEPFLIRGEGAGSEGQYPQMRIEPGDLTGMGATKPEAVPALIEAILKDAAKAFRERPQPERLETFDSTLAKETQNQAFYAILMSWAAILLYLWFRFGNWTFGAAAVICLIHDLCFTLGAIALCHYLYDTSFGPWLGLKDFKLDLPSVAALLTLVGYSVNDTIVVFDRIREVRGKNPLLTEQMINDSVNQTLSRTLLASLTTWLVVFVLYCIGGEGVHLFAFVMVIGVIVGTYSSIYIAAPLLLIFGEGTPEELSYSGATREAVTADE